MTDPKQYSASKCAHAQMLEILQIQCGCVPFYDTLQPNDTDICTPQHVPCVYGAFLGSVTVTASKNGEGHATDMVSKTVFREISRKLPYSPLLVRLSKTSRSRMPTVMRNVGLRSSYHLRYTAR